MQNFKNPTTNPSGRISNELEREREREKMPFIVATYVYASSQGQRTHSTRTNGSHENFVLRISIRSYTGSEVDRGETRVRFQRKVVKSVCEKCNKLKDLYVCDPERV